MTMTIKERGFRMKLELKKYNMRNMSYAPGSAKGRTVLYLAPRNRGKSFLLRDTLYHLRDIPMGIVISPTEGANEFFQHFVPGILIYEEFAPEIIERFVERQKKITKQYNEEIKRFGRTDIDPRAFIVFDDLMYSNKEWVNEKSVRYLFLNGRHTNCFVAVTSQQVMGIPPSLRTNLDNVFILRENIYINRKKIYEQYAGMFPTFDVFCQVLDQTTQNFEAMVIDNRSSGGNINETVFWYKAEARDFKMCAPDIWQLQAMEEERKALKMNDEDDEEEEEDFNPYFRKKNTAIVKVRKGPC
jgi:hypothetical protein